VRFRCRLSVVRREVQVSVKSGTASGSGVGYQWCGVRFRCRLSVVRREFQVSVISGAA
jgi:hypothetical protein